MNRSPLLVALLAGLLLVVAGCTGDAATSTATTASPGATAGVAPGCEPVEYPPVQVGQHIIGDADPPGTYSSVPPTSGWHTSSMPEPGRAATPLRDAEIVAALEGGLVVATVDPEVLAATDDAVVDDLLEQFPDRLVVTPYDADIPTDVALLTWGGMQRCERLEPGAVTAFVLTERTTPEQH